MGIREKIVTSIHLKYILYYLISILSGNFLFAQTKVQGIVTDSASNALPQINIIATPLESEDIVAFAYTRNSGGYELQLKNSGVYRISFSSLSFAKQSIEITVSANTPIIVQNIIMKEQETQLDEVLVQTERPITVKKDTVIFDVAAFTRGNETVVEDLLKNIPGLVVEDDGTIKVGGREVEKVMVDYDDFFDKGYRILTKNMAADAINKVEIIDKYSNNRLLKGIENSNKVAINLSLKEKKRNVWFGNTSLGYGLASENRYNISGNLMSFGKNNKYYFLTSLNNTGEDVSGDLTYVVSANSFDEPGSLGNEQNARSLLNLTAFNTGLKPRRTNFNNVEFTSLNSIFNPAPKLKIQALALFKTDENDFFRNGFETFRLNGESFTNTENYKLRKEILQGFAKIELTYNISKNEMFEYISKYNNSEENTSSDLIFNQDPTNEKLSENNRLIDNKAVYTNKFAQNKVFIFTGRYIDEEIPQDYKVNQFFFEDLFPLTPKVSNVEQVSKTNMKFVGFEAHLLDKKENGNLLELKTGFTSRKDELSSKLILYEQNRVTTPENYGNNTSYIKNDLYVESKFIYKWENILFNTSLDLHQFFNTLELQGIPSTTKNSFFINPKIGAEWEINDRNKLTGYYSYNSKNAEILDVFDSYILTGYRSFLKGTGNYDQLNFSNIFFNYRLGNYSDRFFGYAAVNYSKNYDFFSTNSIIQPNYTQTAKVLIKNQEVFSASVNAERYFKSLSTNLKVTSSFTKSNFENFVNSKYRNVGVANYNYGFELRSGFKGFFNFNVGSTWQYNRIDSGIKNAFTNNHSFMDLNFNFNENFNFQIEGERYYFGSLSKGKNVFNFLDFDAKYSIIKNKLTLSLEGRNLFNVNSFRTYSISDISTSSSEVRLLPRFILLKLDFRF